MLNVLSELSLVLMLILVIMNVNYALLIVMNALQQPNVPHAVKDLKLMFLDQEDVHHVIISAILVLRINVLNVSLDFY
jgi:hypothetical protein